MSGGRPFYEFFAGAGMARAGLGNGWSCVFANDFSPMKAQTYKANWGYEPLTADVATVAGRDLPGTADLAWASFPCQDLSLAGDWKGLGCRSRNTRTRSGTFWPFWSLMEALGSAGRAPRLIVLENVVGAITSNYGRDFAALASSLAKEGYRYGAMVIDAKLFVPQSRPRLFFVAVRGDLAIPAEMVVAHPSSPFHPASLASAHARLPASAAKKWIWWRLPIPPARTKVFADLIEEVPTNVQWDTPADTKRLLAMMSDINRKKVAEASRAGRTVVGGVYKRTRVEAGKKVQRAEVRFDDIAGCLRTPRGGSSRQRILIVNGKTVRSRLLSPVEAVQLMGLPKTFVLPANYNDAYHVAGDGVVVDVVRHLAAHLLEPILQAQEPVREAAE